MSIASAPPTGTRCYFCENAEATRHVPELMHHAKERQETTVEVPACDRCKSRLGFLNGLASLITIVLAGTGGVAGWIGSRYMLEGTNPSRGRGKAVGLIVGAGVFVGGVVAVILTAILKKTLGGAFGMSQVDVADYPAVMEWKERGYASGKLPAQK